MSRPFPSLALCACLSLSAAAANWDDLKAQYQTVTVAGGLGAGNGPNNPNEWNFAEGQNALTAELSEPHSAMMDLNGRIFIADKNAHAIRRIDPDGTIHTVAGMNLGEIAANSGFNGDGPARQRLLNGPQNAYVLPDGTFYILDSQNQRVRRVDNAGGMTTLITDSQSLNRGLWVSRNAQTIYYCTNAQLKRWTPALGNNAGQVIASGFTETGNIDVDATGNIYVSDRLRMGVYRIPSSNGGAAVTEAQRVAGLGNALTTDSNGASNGALATQVGMREPRGVAFHPLGGFFVATHKGGDVWYVDTGGRAWMFIEGDSANTHVAGTVAVPTTFGVMSEPRSVTVSRTGDVVIACNDAGFIRVARNILPPLAAPVLESLSMQPGGARLRWQSDATRWYYLEQNAGLSGAGWAPLATMAATGTLTQFTDPYALTGPRRFYRIRTFRAWPN